MLFVLTFDMKKQDNVAITSSVLNLIDEIECGLIKKEDALNLAGELIENCNSCPVRKLLKYWFDYFIHYY